MARRGSNSFRRNDGLLALRVARDGGMEPSALEIVVNPDGAVTFRVYGEKAAGLMPLAPETAAAAREWQDKLKARTPRRRKDGARRERAAEQPRTRSSSAQADAEVRTRSGAEGGQGSQERDGRPGRKDHHHLRQWRVGHRR